MKYEPDVVIEPEDDAFTQPAQGGYRVALHRLGRRRGRPQQRRPRNLYALKFASQDTLLQRLKVDRDVGQFRQAANSLSSVKIYCMRADEQPSAFSSQLLAKAPLAKCSGLMPDWLVSPAARANFRKARMVRGVNTIAWATWIQNQVSAPPWLTSGRVPSWGHTRVKNVRSARIWTGMQGRMELLT